MCRVRECVRGAVPAGSSSDVSPLPGARRRDISGAGHRLRRKKHRQCNLKPGAMKPGRCTSSSASPGTPSLQTRDARSCKSCCNSCRHTSGPPPEDWWAVRIPWRTIPSPASRCGRILPCIPPAPTLPDLQQAPTFQRTTLLEAYRASAAQTQADVARARDRLDQFSQQLLALEPPSAPTDIWGFVSVAAGEFGTVDSDERVVIIVARDEEIQPTYCDGCAELGGAAVHFLAFDQHTRSDEQRRRSDWSMWLSRVGASGATFSVRMSQFLRSSLIRNRRPGPPQLDRKPRHAPSRSPSSSSDPDSGRHRRPGAGGPTKSVWSATRSAS